ncbi:hypothetical protein EK21DRAFT_85384 [Setomelanomma holmii]|uniref:Uncharacterized protein n=1 Tax=Setomelanomma holmii TaxID=210430 RepID=A0A9P4LS26_9PLEO|nr:hypothetical protein EK21DRAFT_85384 [Setomelanomma holmii]
MWLGASTWSDYNHWDTWTQCKDVDQNLNATNVAAEALSSLSDHPTKCDLLVTVPHEISVRPHRIVSVSLDRSARQSNVACSRKIISSGLLSMALPDMLRATSRIRESGNDAKVVRKEISRSRANDSRSALWIDELYGPSTNSSIKEGAQTLAMPSRQARGVWRGVDGVCCCN